VYVPRGRTTHHQGRHHEKHRGQPYLVEAPANGTVIIKQAGGPRDQLRAMPGAGSARFIAFYQSKPDFSGTDLVVIEIKYSEGRTELQRITVNVGTGPDG
jgi:hypothetical protein